MSEFGCALNLSICGDYLMDSVRCCQTAEGRPAHRPNDYVNQQMQNGDDNSEL